jgi:hypothetical protein
LISQFADEKNNLLKDYTAVRLDLCVLQEEEFIAAIYHWGKLISLGFVLVVQFVREYQIIDVSFIIYSHEAVLITTICVNKFFLVDSFSSMIPHFKAVLIHRFWLPFLAYLLYE